jgi:hypothetical protein
MSPVVCGLDVHKDSTYATILNPEGKIINQTRMDNEKVQSYLLHFKVGKVAMEASTRMVVPKLVCEVSDASGFALLVRVNGCLSCEKHN